MNRCDVCLEQNCPTNHNCNCDTCKSLNECPKYIRPTVRITTKCTQRCAHCCFSCSPTAKEMMTIDTAKDIAKFLRNNNILAINLMGGEFFCNKAWYSILKLLIKEVNHARIVSNGDWVSHEQTKEKLIKLNTELNGKFKISLSFDDWHNNKNVEAAEIFCRQYGITYNIANEENQTRETGIIPVGRAEGIDSIYSMLGCYCTNPSRMYSLLINEIGEIYKCSFGVWKYAKVSQYKDGVSMQSLRSSIRNFITSLYHLVVRV